MKKFTPKSEYTIKSDEAKFPHMFGREIYNQLSYTGLNKSPITKLQAFTLAGLVETGVPPWPVVEISERLLVDGTIIWYQPEGFISDIYAVSDTRILAKIRDAEGKILPERRRRFEKVGAKWHIVDEEFDNKGVWKITHDYGEVEDDPAVIFVYPNELGLLYPIQNLYHRIEEIQKILRAESTGVKRKSIISGFVGDTKQMDEAMRSDKSTINIPGNVTVTHPAATGIVSQLIEEKRDLLIQYDENVFDYVTNDAAAMSGISRRLMMAPMLQFVKGQRKRLTDIFELYQTKLEFDKVQVQTVEERQAEYNLIKLMRDDQVLTPEQFKARALELG